jgi:hypothetical protein
VGAAHESLALGGEHAAFGVDHFAEVLGFDEGMVATEFVDFGLDILQVFGDFLTDLTGVYDEETLLAVGCLRFLGCSHFTGEEGGAGPG